MTGSQQTSRCFVDRVAELPSSNAARSRLRVRAAAPVVAAMLALAAVACSGSDDGARRGSTAGLPPAAGAAVRRFWQAWNRHPEALPIGAAWLEFERARPDLLRHGSAWAAQLAALPELAAGLVKAAGNGV